MSNQPEFRKEQFTCPHCHVVSQQRWFSSYRLSEIVFNVYQHIYLDYRVNIQDYKQEAISHFLRAAQSEFPNDINSFVPSNCSIAICQSCDDFSLWVDEKLVYPNSLPIEPPNEDLNEDIRSLYNEAANIFVNSPKGATALLRLALQKLLIQVGKTGRNINNDIKELVESGLSPKIQQALDLVRVVGNNAVHPGQINLDDDSDIALKLFKILNIIADELITKEKEMDALYNDIIPEETREHINQRDGRNSDE